MCAAFFALHEEITPRRTPPLGADKFGVLDFALYYSIHWGIISLTWARI
jgi:hypothetical protein